MMKKKLLGITMLIAMSAMILTACFSENAIEDETDGSFLISKSGQDTEETEATGDGNEAEGEESENLSESSKYVTPMASDIDLSSPKDGIVSAAFEAKDFNLEAGELTFTIYSVDNYVAEDINMLQIGDIILYNGKEIKVELIEDKSGSLHINGGFDKGGCSLWPTEENTYVAKGENNYPTYTQIGTITMALSDAIKISDSFDSPNNPVETALEGLSDYLGKLEENSKGSFSNYNTTLEIKNGKVSYIIRTN